MRFLANVLFAACLSVVALSLEAAAEGRVEKGELYTLYHDPSDLILDTSVRPVWLDDSRLMFRANGLVKKKEAFFKGKTKLYIWTIGGGVEFYNDFTDERAVGTTFVPGICFSYFSRNLYRFKSTNPNEISYFYGPMGREKVKKSPRPTSRGMVKFNWETCEFIEEPSFVFGFSGWTPLHQSYGFLLSKITKNPEKTGGPYQSERYLKPYGWNPFNKIRVDIPGNGYVHGQLYYPHLKAYLVLGRHTFYHGLDFSKEEREAWEKKGCLRAWLLFSEGKTKEVCIPYSKWSAGISGGYFNSFIKTRTGHVFVNMSSSKTHEGKRGISVVKGEAGEFVPNSLGLRHFVGALSPNGCRTAVWSNLDRVPDSRGTIKNARSISKIAVLDVCAPK